MTETEEVRRGEKEREGMWSEEKRSEGKETREKRRQEWRRVERSLKRGIENKE